MQGVQIRIGGRKDFENDLCYEVPDGSYEHELDITCDSPMVGRYVTVSTTKSGEWLTLCETEIFSSQKGMMRDSALEK